VSEAFTGSRTLAAGHMLGRYRLSRLLGSGAMGDVYLAEDPHIERQLAIKTVRIGEGKPADLEDRKRRLLREAKAAGKLVHPNVVTLYDAGEAEGVLFLAFEFVSGSDLAHRLEDGPALTVGEVLRIGREAADALECAHRQGIVHRDIKPANLLLDQSGRVKVADFGIAKMVGQGTELTMDGSIVGSPHYLSPEQVRGEVLDGRSDVFSLGVVLYEMFGKQRPFQGESLTTLVYQILHQEPPPVPCARPDLAPRLAQLLNRMLAKDREHRFPSAAAVVAELQALERELPLEVLALPASADAEVFEGTRRLAAQPATASAAISSAPTMAPGPAVPTMVRPPPVPLAGATEPRVEARRSNPLPFILIALFLVIVGVGVGAWWFLFGRKPPVPPTVQTSVPAAVAVATQPPAQPQAQPPAPVTTPANGKPAVAATTPSGVPSPTVGEPRTVEPRRTEPAPPPTTVEVRPERVSPPPTTQPVAPPARPPVEAQPEPATIPVAPPPEPAPALSFDREMATGLDLVFKVTPAEAQVKVRPISERRGISIGQAGDWTGKGDEGRAYGLSDGAGDYLVTISHGGVEHVILVHAVAGRPVTTITHAFAGTGKRKRGN
jgi:eukaryotic-like serine/threonine-protein kinase